MEIKQWPIDPILKAEINEHYRTLYALSLKNESLVDIVKKITFDSVAPNITTSDVEKFINYVNSSFLKNKLKGVGLEVGGGCGFFSALFATNVLVEKIYSVEICENIVKELMPKVVDEVSLKDNTKVIGCIGDFDKMGIDAGSIDFIFDFYALHHSNNLNKTFKELYRVLKPGGFVFCFDKTRANSLTNEDLEKLLDIEYSKTAKINMGLSPDIFHTRRMNGEKEYRLNDWKSAFINSGFTKFEHYHIARIPNKKSINNFIKTIISFLPIKLQILITNIFAKNGNVNNLEQTNKIYTKLVNNFPKEISLMIVWK